VARVHSSDLRPPSLSALISLDGRVAVVTGGAGGIGQACCARLAEAGARVVVADVDEAAATRAAEAIGSGALADHVDVSNSASVRLLVERVVLRFARLDVWVNAAGIYPATPLLELGDGEWDDVLDVNLRGSFLGAREAARAMVAADSGGVVVNVASTAAYRVDGAGVAHYVASKFGVRGLTQSLAVELGPRGVRVLAVAPTVTRTPGLEAQRQRLESAGFVLDDLAGTLPLRRIAEPDDVARVVLFCASDLASMMTGSTLLVDGGALA
jgi:NAD(P)-dependent dehydrogenase (short-subunit alcohol dehydrogenase family)